MLDINISYLGCRLWGIEYLDKISKFTHAAMFSEMVSVCGVLTPGWRSQRFCFVRDFLVLKGVLLQIQVVWDVALLLDEYYPTFRMIVVLSKRRELFVLLED